MSLCYIFGAVPVKAGIVRNDGDLVIAADGGLDSLKNAGIIPDVFLGDMDSVSDAEVTADTEIIIHPVEKDDTDSALAVQYAAEHGFTKFIVYGCIGGNLDHTLANCALLKNMTEQGFSAVFADGENALTAVSNGKLYFGKESKGRVSILSMSDMSVGVDIHGMKYTVSDATLTSSVPLGVSNEFTGESAYLSVEHGTLCVYTSMKNLMEHSNLFDK